MGQHSWKPRPFFGQQKQKKEVTWKTDLSSGIPCLSGIVLSFMIWSNKIIKRAPWHSQPGSSPLLLQSRSALLWKRLARRPFLHCFDATTKTKSYIKLQSSVTVFPAFYFVFKSRYNWPTLGTTSLEPSDASKILEETGNPMKSDASWPSSLLHNMLQVLWDGCLPYIGHWDSSFDHGHSGLNLTACGCKLIGLRPC